MTTGSGEQKLMRNLKIGEEVVSDQTGATTTFIGWMEFSSTTHTKMIEMETEDGEVLVLTDTHIVFMYEHDAKPTPIFAKNLKPGNVLVGGLGEVGSCPDSVTCNKFLLTIHRGRQSKE